MNRVYLDHNATTPLRPEARAAMIAAMDVIGNPSSVHAEGRAAKALIERARAQVLRAVNASDADVIFTSGATEAAALAFAAFEDRRAALVEHDCVTVWASDKKPALQVDASGRIDAAGLSFEPAVKSALSVQAANSETGVLQDLPKIAAALDTTTPRPFLICDAVQAAGKTDWSFDRSRVDMALLSAHKFGGPRGVGALVIRRGIDVPALLKGGGQEMGRRAGTENILGIAGFGAAIAAAARDVDQEMWEKTAELRNILETALEAGSNKTIFVGNTGGRLPNTSCLITEGWRGETQVMQMDLAGFAISAGSACSSGKVRASNVLLAMGYSEAQASSAIRVSLGLETTKDDVMRFAGAWLEKLKKHNMRAA